jgi:phosphate transport system protein
MTVPRREFERELEAIEVKVIQLFALVAEDLGEASRGLLDGDSTVPTVLAERGREIDALYRQVEELVQREIMLQAPVAGDLRFLLSVLRIAPELERSHELIVEIAADSGIVSANDLLPAGRATIAAMAELAKAMWRQAADSWYERDRSVADALADEDKAMGDLHSTLFAQLAAGGMSARATMELTLVARCYQRLAAHAVSIARRVIYLAGPPRS